MAYLLLRLVVLSPLCRSLLTAHMLGLGRQLHSAGLAIFRLISWVLFPMKLTFVATSRDLSVTPP